MSFTWLPIDWIKEGWKQFAAGAVEAGAMFKEMGTVLGTAWYELLCLPFVHWQITLGVIAYWIVSIIIIEKTEGKKGMLYPAFRYQIWAISGFAVACMPAYFLFHALMYVTDKDYRQRSKSGTPGPNDDWNVGASGFLTLFIAGHLIVGIIGKNSPPQPEDVKFTNASGQVCYAYMGAYKDFKTKEETPYIAHSHCDKPIGKRVIASTKDGK